MTRETRHTKTFTAVTDDGDEVTIFEFTDFHRCHTTEGSSTVQGLKDLRTADGRPVNRKSKGVYHYSASSCFLRSVARQLA